MHPAKREGLFGCLKREGYGKEKKDTAICLAGRDGTSTAVFEHYHQVAHHLRMSKDQKQAETALAEITILPERAQIALLKALAKDHQVDAADILTALHELSPLKIVRKEARRSLIQLESTKISPRWEPPLDRTDSQCGPTTDEPAPLLERHD
jgi:hypothetical protein